MLRYVAPIAMAVAAVAAPARADDEPMTLSVSTLGRFAQGNSWYLSVNSAGQAELTVTGSSTTRKQFQVTKEQWAEFRKAVADGRFFDTAGEYGDDVPDGSERSITVTAGRYTHTVKVRFLRSSTPEERAKRREAAGPLKLLVLVRGWFDEPEAVDLRRFDQADIDSAKE